MVSRIVVAFKDGEFDPAGRSLEKSIKNFLNIKIKSIKIRRAYILNSKLSSEDVASLEKNLFVDPVTEYSVVDSDGSDWIIEVSYKPGVTNPVSKTVVAAVNDIIGRKIGEGDYVSTATQYLISGIGKEDAEKIATKLLSNPIIEEAKVFSGRSNSNSPNVQYQVSAKGDVNVGSYNLNVDDGALLEISKKGVLSLSLSEMKTIQKYAKASNFLEERKKIGMDKKFWSQITDAELEMIAQTQSEHCKHKIFNANISYTDESGKKEKITSLFKTYIKAPTAKMQQQYPWILSAFDDNAGIVDVGNGLVIADKIETHNTPSALEPYGGAITGILGVNRDILGAGMGAKPLFNVFGYCFGNPFYDKELSPGTLHPARIRSGVHKGVIDGGNQSGIPLIDGFEIFDDRYGFRPLVYCGTIGIMPKSINGKASYQKRAQIGDLIVMVGGRIGKDGIHGATFSSAGLDKGSPVQAVQIGDSITQKKMSDFLIEARDLGLYRSITDNGAGGLSSSVGEMARDTDGCILDLKKAPLKYSGLAPWEILVSESQERMTVAIDPSKRGKFLELAKRRGVEATVLGEFTDSGKMHITYGDATVVYLDMQFLHDGFEKISIEGSWNGSSSKQPRIKEPSDMNKVLMGMLGRLNICSKEYKMRQYDHEVKGLSVVKPFVGREMDVPSDATVSLLSYGSKEGLIAAHGINPYYSEIDTYHMTASVIDEAIRRVIAAGGKLPDKKNVMYALDNFCWNISSLDSEDGKHKIGQLVRANKALADYCTAFGVPCISGKDSMTNVWKIKGAGKSDQIISVLPTLLFSVRAKMDDVGKAVTMDTKNEGDLVYVIGNTSDELGASEYFSYAGGETGGSIPKVDAKSATKIYSALSSATEKELVSSIHTPTIGGLGITLAQSAFAGGYGMDVDLRKVPYSGEKRDDYMLFSQSNSRFVVTIPSKNQEEFEKVMGKNTFAKIGVTTKNKTLRIIGISGKTVVNSSIDELKSAWKNTLKGV